MAKRSSKTKAPVETLRGLESRLRRLKANSGALLDPFSWERKSLERRIRVMKRSKGG